MVSHSSALYIDHVAFNWIFVYTQCISFWPETSLPPSAQCTGMFGSRLHGPRCGGATAKELSNDHNVDVGRNRFLAKRPQLTTICSVIYEHVYQEQVTSRSACGKLGPGVGSLLQLLLPEFAIGNAYLNTTLDRFDSVLFVHHWWFSHDYAILRVKSTWGRKNHWASPIWLCGGPQLTGLTDMIGLDPGHDHA